MFRITHDIQRNIIIAHIRGFWTLEDVAAYAAALLGKAREAAAIRNDFDVLIESLDFPVQANDVADALSQIMEAGIGMLTGRVGVVVGSQLNKAQAERTLIHPRVKVFRNVAEAERWLDQGRITVGQPSAD